MQAEFEETKAAIVDTEDENITNGGGEKSHLYETGDHSDALKSIQKSIELQAQIGGSSTVNNTEADDEVEPNLADMSNVVTT